MTHLLLDPSECSREFSKIFRAHFWFRFVVELKGKISSLSPAMKTAFPTAEGHPRQVEALLPSLLWCKCPDVPQEQSLGCHSTSVGQHHFQILPNINLQFCMSLLWQPDQYLKRYRTCCLSTGFKSHRCHHWEEKAEITRNAGLVLLGRAFQGAFQPPYFSCWWATSCPSKMSRTLCNLIIYSFTCCGVPVAISHEDQPSNRSKKLFLVLLFHPADGRNCRVVEDYF